MCTYYLMTKAMANKKWITVYMMYLDVVLALMIYFWVEMLINWPFDFSWHLVMFCYRETQQDIFNAMGSIYAAILFVGITNATAVQPVVSVERFVSYRERAAGMYSALPFAMAQVYLLIINIFSFPCINAKRPNDHKS